ncbi:MAG: hypothetical protein IPN01_32770 [Deltaproteobacteria bacterium]|nr:hypothetical protein [Deltaproteobacteria bacterium]
MLARCKSAQAHNVGGKAPRWAMLRSSATARAPRGLVFWEPGRRQHEELPERRRQDAERAYAAPPRLPQRQRCRPKRGEAPLLIHMRPALRRLDGFDAPVNSARSSSPEALRRVTQARAASPRPTPPPSCAPLGWGSGVIDAARAAEGVHWLLGVNAQDQADHNAGGRGEGHRLRSRPTPHHLTHQHLPSSIRNRRWHRT